MKRQIVLVVLFIVSGTTFAQTKKYKVTHAPKKEITDYKKDWNQGQRDSANMVDSIFNAQYKAAIKKYGKKYGPLVLTGDIKLGMTGEMIVGIKGREPDRIITNTYSFGIHQQWVYEVLRGNTEYFYFENGKLVSWQN